MDLSPADRALVELGRRLRAAGYRFVTPTPETHRRVNARPGAAEARTLRDVFGWSRPFRPGLLPDELLAPLRAAGALEEASAGLLRSAVRFSSAAASGPLADLLHAHSAFPTLAPDAVFFGPDTYRFLELLRREARPARRAADVGCGSGAGGLALLALGRAHEVVLADVSARALRFAAVNAALAGPEAVRRARLAPSDVLAGVEGPLDLVVANPPYLVDERRRVYRDGGGARGLDLSVRIAREALDRLAPGGRLLLYTATPVVEGRDPLREALEPVLAAAEEVDYRELDPDVFGEELERPPYADVERIAVVALACRVPARGARRGLSRGAP